jgi:hypothetical protein
MKRKTMSIPALLAVGLCLAGGSTSSAHDGESDGTPTHRPQVYTTLLNPQGRPVTQQQDGYRYVVPPVARQGAYYRYENGNYYTPPVQRQLGQPPVAPRPVNVEFGAFKHLVELSERIEALTNDLCLDLRYNYHHNPGFKEVYREAYQLLQGAKFIHDREHHGDREAIRGSVTKIDNLIDHLQDEVSGLKRQETRPVGQLKLEAKTEELQALIHHLMFDVGVKPDHDKDEPDQEAPAREEAPPPSEDPGPRR